METIENGREHYPARSSGFIVLLNWEKWCISRHLGPMELPARPGLHVPPADRAYRRHIAGNAFPLHSALAEHAGPVPDLFTVCHPVGHENTGNIHIPDEPAREILYRLCALRVKCGKWLIKHQEDRLEWRGPGQARPAASARRKGSLPLRRQGLRYACAPTRRRCVRK